jgi:hypothetical protein
VRQGRHGDGLDVVGGDEVASGEHGPAARQLQQRQRAARARAHGDSRALAGRGDEVDDVEADRLRYVHVLDRVLHGAQLGRIDHGPELDLVLPSLEPAREQVGLVLAGRIADRHAQQEAVELRLGERVRPLELDRVLRREDEERPLERPRRPLGRHLVLLHRLEERRLRLRRGAVDLVGEQ